MADQDEILAFLRDFHVKMNIWGIVVRDDRGKNTQTLLALEITKDARNEVLKSLAAEDCSGHCWRNFMEVLLCGCLVKW